MSNGPKIIGKINLKPEDSKRFNTSLDKDYKDPDGENPEEDEDDAELEESEIRKYIRELLLKGRKVNEFDALYAKQSDWQKESTELKDSMLELLKHIEDDQYKEGLDMIDKVISKLEIWKTNINKQLS